MPYWVGSQAPPTTATGAQALRTGKVALIAEPGPFRPESLKGRLPNGSSQRVLERNGFVRIGLAPHYLKIAGRWQDCVLHQLLAKQ